MTTMFWIYAAFSLVFIVLLVLIETRRNDGMLKIPTILWICDFTAAILLRLAIVYLAFVNWAGLVLCICAIVIDIYVLTPKGKKNE